MFFHLKGMMSELSDGSLRQISMAMVGWICLSVRLEVDVRLYSEDNEELELKEKERLEKRVADLDQAVKDLKNEIKVDRGEE